MGKNTNANHAGPLDYVIPAITLIISWALGAWFYSHMPETVAVHWGLSGEPDRFGSRLEGALLVPLLLTLLFVVFYFVSRTTLGKAMLKIASVTGLFMIALQIIIGMNSLGVIIDVARMIILSMAGLFLLLGLLIPTFPQNKFGGFRNKYTLSDLRVWESTNKLGGRMMMVAALLMVPFAFTPPLIGFIGIMLVIVICIVVIPLMFSMSMYRKVKAKH